MKRLINNETEDSTSGNSSDVRHRARITEQQQQHLEELKKLQESIASKAGSLNTSTEPVSSTSALRSDANEVEKEKKVDTSRSKGILRIVAEKFSILIERSSWKKITSALRFLFGGKSVDEILLEVKTGNKTIKSLLALLRNKEKLALQIKIAVLLREINLGRDIGRNHLNRVLHIQNSLISNLSSVARETSGKRDVQSLLSFNNQALAQSSFLSAQVVKKIEVSHSIGKSSSGAVNIDCPSTLFPAYYTFTHPVSHSWLADLRAFAEINISAAFKSILKEVKNRIIGCFMVGNASDFKIGSMRTGISTSANSSYDTFIQRQIHQQGYISERQTSRESHGSGCPCCSQILETRQSLRLAYSISVTELGGPKRFLHGTSCNNVSPHAQGIGL